MAWLRSCRSSPFYQDVLGFQLLESRGPPKDIGWVLLRHSGVQVMLNTAYEGLLDPDGYNLCFQWPVQS